MDGKPVDLDRERRIRATLDKLDDLMDRNPSLWDRSMAVLAGKLACPDLEKENTTMDQPISMRLPTEVLERLDALLQYAEKDPEITIFQKPTRSSMLRLAVLRGVEVLEKQYSKGKK